MYRTKKLATGLLLTTMTGAILFAPIIPESQLFETKVASAHSVDELTVEKVEKVEKKKEKVSDKDKKELKVESLFDNKITKKFKTETTQIGEHTISYEIYKGKGKVDKTHVLVHGATATGEWMKVVAAELVKQDPKSRVLIVDLPLHGKSTGPMDNLEDVNVNYYADVMNDFLKQEVKEGTIQGKVSYVGWSMGGSIGLLLDLKDDAPIDELTLLNSSPAWEEIVPLLPVFTPETGKAVMTSIVEGDMTTNISSEHKAEIMNNLDKLFTGSSEVLVQDFYGLVPEFYDVREDLDEIDAKTLIIASTKDTLINMDTQKLMDEEIKESKLIVYEGEVHQQLIKPIQAEKIVNEMLKYQK